MLWPKKNSYKEFANEKKFLGLQNSRSPHNTSNGPSLSTKAGSPWATLLQLAIYKG